MPRGSSARLATVLAATRPRVLLVAAGLVAADTGSHLGGEAFFPGGPLDELAHLLTALLVLWALGRRVCERVMVPALIASVAIDLDYLPERLGANILSAGTPRPYTHSLLTVIVFAVAAALWRSRRRVLLGVVLGLVAHFWRDLSDPYGSVALIWPVSDRSFGLPTWSYAALLAGIVVVLVLRGNRLRVRAAA
jgi:inner membrane protein